MESECAICIDSEDGSLKQKFKCNHHFHVNCVNQLLSFQCPMCRQDMKNSLTKRQKKIIERRISAHNKVEISDEELALQQELMLLLSTISFLLQPPVILTFDK